MKGDGYPEDSTQSAYSSQLIWIPLSHHFFSFFIFEALFLERQPKDNTGAVIRISDWARCRQMCANMSPFHISDLRSCLHQIGRVGQHSSFRRRKLSGLSHNLLCPTFVWADDGATERVHCLPGLAERAASTVSAQG